MNLTIDLGNSFCKVIIFQDNVIVYRDVCKSLSTRYLQLLFKTYKIEFAMISSVVSLKPALKNQLKKFKVREFSATVKIPLKNLYTTPKTLGKDRLANAIAGNFLFPGDNVLVIDSGTCIKYDFVNSKKQYLGGSISPGLNMRFIALNKLTDQLPLVEINDSGKLIGNSTVTAIQSGVFNGMVEEIKGIISRYKREYGQLKVILTGGDAQRFAGQLNLSIFAASDLVNIGLNEIIKYNHSK
ncbi:MAG: type III pantothenate kinase [Bacteroidia bacterium]|nr:type III pantothenate kinase [Bacteroidia bacterium]